jgi:hypothetical protein
MISMPRGTASGSVLLAALFVSAAGSPVGCSADSIASGSDAGGDPHTGDVVVGALEFGTDDATNITDVGATLHGHFKGDGTAASSYFEYGPTSAYGTKTNVADWPTGGTHDVTEVVAIFPSRTYHFRFCMRTDGMPTTCGVDSTFTSSDPSDKPKPPPPGVAESADRGFLTMPNVVTGRDAGIAVQIAGGLTWMFGDTVLTVSAQDTNVRIRSSTAARGFGGPFSDQSHLTSDAQAAGSLFDSSKLDGNGAPYEQIRFTADELAYNTANYATNGNRKAHWTSGAVVRGRVPNEVGVVVYTKLDCDGFSCTPHATYTDTFHNDSTVTDGNEKLLFGENELAFRPSGYVDPRSGYVYVLNATLVNVAFDYAIARVPLEHVEEHGAYEYWKGGSRWTPGQSGYARLSGAQLSDNAASISWNAYLKKYVMVSANHNASLQIRVSDSIAGQWSDPVDVTEGYVASYPGAPYGNYAGHEIPELALDGGRTIIATYHNATSASFGTMRLMAITFE